MKILTTTLLLIFCLAFPSQKAQAQWTLLTDIFSQLDGGTFGSYFNNLDTLGPSWAPTVNETGDLFTELNQNLLDSIPPINIDSNLYNEIGAGFDTLLFNLPGFGLDGSDEYILTGDLDWINDILGNNIDSLGGLFGQYQDSLSLNNPNWEVVIINFDSLTNQQMAVLQDSVNNSGGLANPNGLGGLSDISSQLFDVNLFPDIELAFGAQLADLNYYEDSYSANAKVFRVGSVPQLNKDVFTGNNKLVRFPMEARWHFEVSWINYDPARPFASDAIASNQSNTSGNKGFNPLLLNADYALMTNPTIGNIGNTTFRLLASLGTEVGTYAPDHKNYMLPYTNLNKGYTTSLAAQAGAGFSFTTGNLTAYTLATFGQGQTLKSAMSYGYTSRKLEVGMRYGHIINVRYSTGFASWQSNQNRQANVRNQFTVGIILSELHH